MHDSPQSTEHFRALLQPLLAVIGLELTESQLELLDRHYRLLGIWNRRLNLTSVRDPGGIVRRHFGESLFVAARLQRQTGTLADIGSGAGFPGFPIAVTCAGLKVALIESVGKKAAFLKEISRGVGNVTVLAQRFEEVEAYFEWIVVRGVALRPLRQHLGRKAKHLAVLTSLGQAEGLGDLLGLQERQVDPIPWDPGSVLLCGRFT